MTSTFAESIFQTLKYGGAISLSITLIALAFLYRYQTTLIYPSSFPEGSRSTVPTPKDFGIDYEQISLRTRDKIILDSYLMLQPKAPESRPTLLYFHANAGNMGHRLPIARVFYSALGMNVFIISYRGYGRSTGSSSESGMNIDAQTALDFLREHPVCSSTKIVVYGQSVGGAVALSLASKNESVISALVLENTFTSIKDMIPTVFPYIGNLLSHFCTEKWENVRSIRKINDLPVLFLSGADDEIVPPSQMHVLYSICPSKQKRIRVFPKAKHNDTCLGEGYFHIIAEFLLSNNVWTSPN
ncbi:esterase/lipase [Schizosaccharomyces cryophilus OY26]|uniref:Esterase/lipase n=1 Tax=Schizosaccharomyces cryophilus (strain OY26 / ATCC MYA-4695 / CBS 11777 / NBRC 106824 / NRRL Y48691) TaxID=653667 RepID=S9VSW6_SCHCR|nr:esterase/lipase [Schizosaccharomyces cryophilus OY26]EPY49230.1 esterase/lipase [Schizosaccharomyces cryophilus OY26]